ncbi:hypothetical protein [Encephalitozoon cuniculi GB-M1]|uniref:PH domain-containing protein n=1 Tax=Encephalitozoon cuniculi (strain GB-M1) TaxID=284813 RepID=Q8SWD7_ENCCU|nr:uncharacterized protein ECU02_0650 [Encephalitozoon cuniculi GB-M1]CAD25095.1 hypothetical protein [Encephalitozoon cuniculi GB-M1]
MGKETLNSYLSPITDEQHERSRDPRGLSMGSMDEKLRRINEEFKARACVGNGFVFNRSVKLESPASYFGKDKNSNENALADDGPRSQKDGRDVNGLRARDGFIGGMIPWKPNSSGTIDRGIFHREVPRSSMVGMDLYKKPSIDPVPYATKRGSGLGAIDAGLKTGYVKSMASSSIFNRGSPPSISSSGKAKDGRILLHPPPGRDGQAGDSFSASKSVFSNPLSDAKTPSLSNKTSCQAPNPDLYGRASRSPAFAPIDVMYVKPMSGSSNGVKGVEDTPHRTLPNWHDSCCSPSASNLYAPGHRLTIYPHIRISNSVLCYEGSVETTKYYITVESDVSWTVCKTIGDIKALIPGIRCATLANAMSPQDRRARDRTIQVTLNSGVPDKQLQPFILSDISSACTFRSSYLLMNNEGWRGYLFKFVGKALICYEKSKVFKIFLLSSCNVLPVGQVGFCLEKSGEGIELYTTCEKERDAWVSDIREYISKL